MPRGREEVREEKWSREHGDKWREEDLENVRVQKKRQQERK